MHCAAMRIWRRSSFVLQASSRRVDELHPRVIRFPDTPDVSVGVLDRPPQLCLSVQCDETRDAVIRRAMDEHVLAARDLHDVEERVEIAGSRRPEINRYMEVRHAERFDQASFVFEAIPRIE